MAEWLAKNYAIRYADDVFLFLARHAAGHGTRINPQFWRKLGKEISHWESETYDDKKFSRWVSLLLATLPVLVDEYVLFSLGVLCIKQESLKNLLQVFDAMAESRLILKPSYSLSDDNSPNQGSKTRADLPLLGNHSRLKNLWEKGLKPRLNQVAEPLLLRVVRHLEELHFSHLTWDRANRDWDLARLRRSAIEPHEQDNYPKDFDVLIDSARDCLEWLASNQSQAAARWCDQLAASDTPLLRRLSVHTLSMREDLNEDEKIDWLLGHIELHDPSARHEIFRAVHLAYPAASLDRRSALIKAVQAYHWTKEEEQDKERRAAGVHFDWLHWLHNADPDCSLIKEKLDEISGKYPEFKPSEYPDLTFRIGTGWVGPQSPWSTEELLEKSAMEWLPELLSFQPTAFLGPDRIGIVRTVEEAAKHDFDWGRELADALANSGSWGADLWDALLHAWSKMELDEDRYHEVLRWMDRAELYPEHAKAIAEFLYELVKDDEKPHILKVLPQANEIAAGLWRHLDPAEFSMESDDWLQLVINYPAVILANFWKGSIFLWRKQQETLPKAFSEEYCRELSIIVKDNTPNGRLGRSVLASQFAFLLEADEKWTRESLLPLFDPNNGVLNFQAAWDGFLTGGNIKPAVAEILEGPFLVAVQRIENDHSFFRDKFIEHYTDMVVLYVANPLDIWIPKLFRHGGVDDRLNFAAGVEHQLLNMSRTQQQELWNRWLKSYWINRLEGVPAAIEPEEIERMLGWLPHLGPLFPEAVDLVIKMPQTQLHRCEVVYDLSESELSREHPEAVVRLLMYLEETGSHMDIWNGGKELIAKLLQSEITTELKTNLKELVAKFGLT